MKKNYLFFLPLFIYTCLSAQSPDNLTLPAVNRVYKPYINTVLLYKSGFEMSAPIIRMNSEERLELSFDDLEGDLKNYRYTITHCEADWAPSTLLSEMEYIDGFRDEMIDQHAYSGNTTIHYTHYTAIIPGNNMRPSISGNYILKVFIDNPSDVAFTRRFMIVESNSVTVTGNVHQAASLADRETKQQIDFEVNLNGTRVSDPSREIRVVIQQNERMDNRLTITKPRFTRGEVLDYKYDDGIVFKGGSEFRAMDIRNLMSQSERVRKIEYDSGVYKVVLLDDLKKGSRNYISDKDINGRMLIRCDGRPETSDIDADYARVRFFLYTDGPILTGKIFLMGALTGWEMDDASGTTYNPSLRGYERWKLLKQGYYNYIYVQKDSQSGATDSSPFEGSHWETENVYTILVYLHELGGLTDRLIAVQDLGSNSY